MGQNSNGDYCPQLPDGPSLGNAPPTAGMKNRGPDMGYGVWAGGAGGYHGGQLPDGEDSMITRVNLNNLGVEMV